MIETIIILSVAFWVGWKLSELWSAYTFKEILKDLGVTSEQMKSLLDDKQDQLDTSSEDPQPPELELKIESHPEGLFAYRKSDGFFIAQGKDRKGLMENLVTNLTNVRVVVAKEDGAHLLQE
jgi:hypothetical protein